MIMIYLKPPENKRQVMESAYFKCIKTRNCRRFFKHNYVLQFKIDHELVSKLENFGMLEITEFSKFSNLANDMFKVRMDSEIELSGTINDTLFRLTISREYPELVTDVETILNNWSKNQGSRISESISN